MEEGKRYSLIYLERGVPSRDSERFRNRLAAYYSHNLDSYWQTIKHVIERETGATIPWQAGYRIEAFFRENELRDVLDSITLIYRLLNRPEYSRNDAVSWKNFVTRVLREENLGYQLDSSCGVHYLVDEEFERNRASTLSLLDSPKYASVRAAYEDAYRHMDAHPPDTKAAVRSMFESLEILVKQMIDTQNLNKWVVENTLKDKCLQAFTGDETALKAVPQLFYGFAQWVHGIHNYRHGQASEEPVAPTEEIAIYVLSSGSSFLRWLIGINDRLNE